MSMDSLISNKKYQCECTIHLAKYVHNVSWTKKAKFGIKAIRKFASRRLATTNITIDPELNKYLWGYGARGFPKRLRVRLEKTKVPDSAKGTTVVIGKVYHVPVSSFNGLIDTPLTMVEDDE